MHGSGGQHGHQFGWGRMPSDDALTLMLLGGVGLGLVSVAVVFKRVATWLIGHGVLVPADHAVLPLFGGAGLDAARLVVLAGLLVLALAAFVWLRLRRRAVALAKEAARPAGVVAGD